MLDPTLRTTVGLETLIQKEWVAMGYPFTVRHKMVSASEGKDDSEGYVSGACARACVCVCVHMSVHDACMMCSPLSSPPLT